MEKLNLNKFQDVKLDFKQMSFIHAGESTGGDSISESHLNSSGQYVETTISWNSDESGHWGQILCYSGYKKTVFICNPN